MESFYSSFSLPLIMTKNLQQNNNNNNLKTES